MRRRRPYQTDENRSDIDELKWLWYAIESDGGIFIGNTGDDNFALASDGSTDLVKLKIAPGETLTSILKRLNDSIENCIDGGDIVDEFTDSISLTDEAPN